MPSVVIKPAPDLDQYVIWSTITDSPHAYGNRAEVVEMLRAGIRHGDRDDRSNPDAAIDRADEWGSSAYPLWGRGHWHDDTYVYAQAGFLRRKDLWQAAGLEHAGRRREILDLLTPLDDDEGGRRLAEARTVAGTTGTP